MRNSNTLEKKQQLKKQQLLKYFGTEHVGCRAQHLSSFTFLSCWVIEAQEALRAALKAAASWLSEEACVT